MLQKRFYSFRNQQIAVHIAQLQDISLPLGLFHTFATACWSTTRVNVTCVLCCSPRLYQGQSANLTAWVRSRQCMPGAFLTLRGWRPCLRQRWVRPAGTLLILYPRKTIYPGYHQLQLRDQEALLATTVLCVCPGGLEKFLLFFFLLGVLVLKIKSAEKGVCRFCYWSQVFVLYFVI